MVADAIPATLVRARLLKSFFAAGATHVSRTRPSAVAHIQLFEVEVGFIVGR